MEIHYVRLLDGAPQKYVLFLHHPRQENLEDYQTEAFNRKDAKNAQRFYVNETS